MPLAIATDPPVSEKQRRAMFAAKAGHSTLGIPQSVGEEFTSADPGGKLPEHAKAKDMARTKWSALKRLLLEWIDEERAEPEHATDAEKRPKPDVGFEHPAKGTDHCADCTHFEAPDACELVEGRVQPRDWCKMFLASQTRPEAEDEDPRVRAAGIAFVTPEGKTLFLRRSDASDHEGEWCFPGGVIEAGETPEEAAIREASEETGYSAREGAGGMRQAHRHLHDGVEFTTFYQPVAAPFDPNLNDESTEHAWHPIDAAPDPIHPGVRATIDEILANLDDSAENEAEDAVKHDPKTGQFTSSSGTSYSTKPKEKGGGSTVHHESGEIGNTNFIAPNPNYPKDKSGYTAWSSHTKGYVGSPRSTAGASAASRTMGSLLGRKPTINPRLFTSEHHAIKGLIEHHEAHKASAQDTPTTSALPDAARRARLRGRGDLARRIEAEDAEIKRDEHGQFAASQGYNEVAHNQEGQPWTWAKKIGADPSGTTHTVNIKHAGEPKSFIATRLFKPSGTISGGSVLVGKHASFKEAHEASLKAINSLPRMKDAPPFGQDEVKHDPKTGQFTSGEGAAGFGDLHKTYGKGGYLDSHTLEESHPHTVAEFSKAFVSHDPGSYEQHQELNKTKKRLSADPSHSSGAVEDTHKMIAQRLRANHGTPARPAAVQRTAAMSRYLKDKVGGRAKDSGIGPNGHLTVGAQTDPNGGFGWAIGGKVGTGKRQMRMSSAVKSGRGLANVAQDMALATDKRTYDKDGRLHVDRANVTKACVNPYTGAEINAVMKGTDNWKMLDPDRRYALLRHPDELRKAVDTFNGLPILFTHKPASAQDHPHEITVGATGNDASWEPPYVRNSLSIWPAYASEAIDDGSQRQLSMGYAYRAEMTPGVYEGEKYDGVMRDIVGNHLAMVREGRAGADVAIDRALISWRGIAAAIRELRT
jgi:8-oxo-dGTP pyrophosphatase MutT (NUDIX family)